MLRLLRPILVFFIGWFEILICIVSFFAIIIVGDLTQFFASRPGFIVVFFTQGFSCITLNGWEKTSLGLSISSTFLVVLFLLFPSLFGDLSIIEMLKSWWPWFLRLRSMFFRHLRIFHRGAWRVCLSLGKTTVLRTLLVCFMIVKAWFKLGHGLNVDRFLYNLSEAI